MNQWKELTGLSVLLVLPVQAVHSLQQLPLLAAARVVDKVPGKDLFELADREVFYRLLVVQVRQRRSDPPLCCWTDLNPVMKTHYYTLSFFVFLLLYKHPARETIMYTISMGYFFLTSKIFSVCSRFRRDAVEVSSCSCLRRNSTKVNSSSPLPTDFESFLFNHEIFTRSLAAEMRKCDLEY